MKRLAPLALACVLAPGRAAQYVQPTEGWYSGDPHIHMQPCDPPPPGWIHIFETTDDIDNNLDLIRDDMLSVGLNVGNVLIWAKGDPPAYTNAEVWDNLRGLIDGQLLPQSDPENDLLMIYGIETSGLSVADMCHIIVLRPSGSGETDLLGIGDPSCTQLSCPVLPHGNINDGSGDYEFDAIQYLRVQHPDALLGIAHQFWTSLYSDESPHMPSEGQ